MEFNLDNVVDGWKYFVGSYYYSNGQQQTLKISSSYTVIFPEEPQFVLGDVDGNGLVEIADVTELIDYLLSGGTIGMDAADMDQDGEVSISDVSAIIDFLLSN
jgi:hypothetical protein